MKKDNKQGKIVLLTLVLIINTILLSQLVLAENEKLYVTIGGSTAYSENSDNKVQYHHKNSVAGTTITTNEQGEKVSENNNYPYGKELNKESYKDSNNLKFSFSGKEQDYSQLHYFNQRYYDSNSLSFPTIDPVFDSSVTPYRYANNNPIKFVDPDGRDSLLEAQKILLGKTLPWLMNNGFSGLVNSGTPLPEVATQAELGEDIHGLFTQEWETVKRPTPRTARIQILHTLADDPALLAHELTHAKDAQLGLGNTLAEKYFGQNHKTEYRAYRVQSRVEIKLYGEPITRNSLEASKGSKSFEKYWYGESKYNTPPPSKIKTGLNVAGRTLGGLGTVLSTLVTGILILEEQYLEAAAVTAEGTVPMATAAILGTSAAIPAMMVGYPTGELILAYGNTQPPSLIDPTTSVHQGMVNPVPTTAHQQFTRDAQRLIDK